MYQELLGTVDQILNGKHVAKLQINRKHIREGINTEFNFSDSLCLKKVRFHQERLHYLTFVTKRWIALALVGLEGWITVGTVDRGMEMTSQPSFFRTSTWLWRNGHG